MRSWPSARSPAGTIAVLAGAATLLLAACGGGGDAALTSSQATVAPELETIPIEPLPDELPEAFIIRGDGTQLVEEARDEILYIVQPGDSLSSIAAAFEVDATELQRINGIADPSVLRAGDELRVPVREGTQAERIAATLDREEEDFSGPPPGEEYTVQPGDTLYEIGLAFGISYLEIQRYNRLTEFEASNLAVGSTLIIPPPPDAEDPEEVEEPPG